MDDLISRQAAIDVLNVGAELLNRVLDDADIVGVERAKYEWGLGLIESYIYDMKELPSAKQWIPCSERLPRTNGVYNVTRKISDGFECRNISDACYYDGANTWHDDTRVNHERVYLTDVIAWMPRPKPYKGEES